MLIKDITTEVEKTFPPLGLKPRGFHGLKPNIGEREIPFLREQDLLIQYRGRNLKCAYRADFVCFGEIIVELKAIGGLTSKEQAQLINYLKATGLSRGLLLNFGAARLETKRFRHN